jgi:hypothetical protein
MSEPAKTEKVTARTKKPSRGKGTAKRRKQSATPPKTTSAEVRQRMIAEAAYFKAESRGFAGGDPELDWHEAETEVDTILLGTESPKS